MSSLFRKEKKSENIWGNKLPVSEKKKKERKEKETSNILFTKSYNDV